MELHRLLPGLNDSNNDNGDGNKEDHDANAHALASTSLQ